MDNKEFREKLAEASRLAKDLDLDLARSLDLDLDLDLSRSLARSLSRSLDLDLDLDLSRSRSLDLARSLSRSLDLAQSRSRSRSRSLNLDLDLDLALDWVRDRGRDRVLALDLARFRNQARQIIKILEELQPTAQSSSEPQISDSLELSIEVPENVSEEELRDILRQAALHADSVHRSHGGKGLKIDAVEAFEEIRVPGGVK